MMGVLKKVYGKKDTILKLPEDSTVGAAIESLINNNEVLRGVLWDLEVNSPSPNALILVNGVEINNLQGLETLLTHNQELVILSVVHGG
jgi:molybdopterin converting factor small subunit